MAPRILFVSYSFPPGVAVGGKRIARLVRCFRERGWQCGVVAADASLVEGMAPDQTLPQYLVDIPKLYCGAYRLPLERFWIQGAGWIPMARRAAADLLRQPDWQQTDSPIVLFTSSPPSASHLVARRLKRDFGSKLFWIADFRDPWVYPEDPRWTPSGIMNRRLYHSVLCDADLLVGTTNAIVELVSQRNNESSSKGLLLRNSVDRGLFENLTPPYESSSTIDLCHFGDLGYNARNPRDFLGAVARLIHERYTGDRPIQIHFYGQTTNWDGRTISDFSREFGIENHVFVHGQIPHRAALERILSTDILLLFANAQAPQIPSKIYEYLYSNRSILAFCEAGETQRLLKSAKTATIVPTNDHPAIEQGLREALAKHLNGGAESNDPHFLGSLTTEANFEVFYEALKGKLDAFNRVARAR